MKPKFTSFIHDLIDFFRLVINSGTNKILPTFLVICSCSCSQGINHTIRLFKVALDLVTEDATFCVQFYLTHMSIKLSSGIESFNYYSCFSSINLLSQDNTTPRVTCLSRVPGSRGPSQSHRQRDV